MTTRHRPELCRCGHSRAAHLHFRPGSDCGHGAAHCARYRAATPTIVRLVGAAARRAVRRRRVPPTDTLLAVRPRLASTV